MPDFSIPPFDERVYAFLREAGLPEDLVDPGQHRSHALAELYVLELVIDLVEQLGMTDLLARPRTAAELLEAREFVPGFRTALCWLLERLVAAGKLTRDGQGRNARYRLPAPLPASGRQAVRGEALAVDPSYTPAYALLDEAAAAYPRVARGETTGERALFQKIALWCAYFSNENRYYAINNRLGAAAAAARLGAEPACVLEVGAGLGSATEALLELLSARGHVGALTSYRFTEPVPFFRRRAQRTLEAAHPGVPFVFSALDINQPWPDQGVEPGRFQLVWGVNVFHLARNLGAALREALASLAPGAWLVLGEGLRPFAGQPIGAEFPFQILESFVDVEIDPETRPTAGFLTPEQWQRALEMSGFTEVRIVPDLARLRECCPGFFAGAVCGRRP